MIGDIRLVDPLDAEAMDEHLDQKTVSIELARHLEKLLTPREQKCERRRCIRQTLQRLQPWDVRRAALERPVERMG